MIIKLNDYNQTAIFKRLLLCLIVATGITSVYAQNLDLDIPEQSTDQSLLKVAEIADVQMVFATDKVKNKTSSALNGNSTLIEALDQLLENTGLIYEIKDKRVVIKEQKVSLNTESLNADMQEPDTDADADADAENDNVLTVIGKRVVRRHRTESIEPTLVYDIEFFQRFEPSNLREMLLRVPGITFESLIDSNEFNLKFRGIAGRRGGQILINGRRLPGADGIGSNEVNIDNIPAELIKQIEVIRSPTPDIDSQGTGLTINIILKDGADIPVDEGFNWRAAVVSADDYTDRELSLSTAGALTDSHTYSINLVNSTNVSSSENFFNEADGRFIPPGDPPVITNIFTGSESNSDSLSLNATIGMVFDSGSSLDIRSYAVETKSDSSSFGRVVNGFGASDELSLISDSQSDELRFGISNTYLYLFDNHDAIEANLSYDKVDVDDESTDFIDFDSSFRDRTTLQEREELKLDMKFEISLDEFQQLKFGFLLEETRQDTKSDTDANSGSLDEFENTSHDESGQDFFVQYVISLTEAVSFQIGSRYESTDYDYSSNFVTSVFPPEPDDPFEPLPPSTPLPGETAASLGTSGNNPSAQLRWKITNTNQLRFSVARTVNQPDFFDLAPIVIISRGSIVDDNDDTSINASTGSPDLRPERSNGFDISYDFNFADSGIIGLSVFHKKTKDQLVNVEIRDPDRMRQIIPNLDELAQSGGFPQIDIVSISVNRNDTLTHEGAELDFSIPMTLLGLPELSVSSNISYSEETSDNPDSPGTFYQTTANLTLDHRIGSFTYGISYNYTSDDEETTVTSFGSFVSIDSRQQIRDDLVNVFVEKRFSDTFLVRLNIDNVLDGKDIFIQRDNQGFYRENITEIDPVYSLTLRGSF